MPTATDTWTVRKRDGRTAEFHTARIADALRKAFRAEMNLADGQPLDEETEADVQRIAAGVAEELAPLAAAGPVDVEKVQDFVEIALMRSGHYRVARAYITYRAEHAKRRALQRSEELEAAGRADEGPRLHVALADGARVPFDPARVRRRLAEAARGLETDVNVEDLSEEVLRGVFDGITPAELDRAMILAARSRIERDPAYDMVAARLMRVVVHLEALGTHEGDPEELEALYRHQFEHYLIDGVAAGRLDPVVRTFDTPRLAKALRPDRDGHFKYLGLQTIYDRYLLHVEGRRIETPQYFWMRVAMGLASCEGEARSDRAIEFYELLSELRFTSATPTLFNSATLHPQLSSCYLTTVQDDLTHIFKSVGDNAALSKWAGGLGNDWTNIRATGSHIKGTNGQSQGVIPFLKIVSDAAVAVNQCFAPDTGVFTADGVKPIAAVEPGDLVLGQRGEYREVLDHYVYDQPAAEQHGGGMVEVDVKHSVHPLRVTAGHPVWAVRAPGGCGSFGDVSDWLRRARAKEKLVPEWVEAGDLKKHDFVAQVVPDEKMPVQGFAADDARMLGLLLSDQRASDAGAWRVSDSESDSRRLAFTRAYLDARGLAYDEEEVSAGGDVVIRWAAKRSVVRDGTTGAAMPAGDPSLPFEAGDLYDTDGNRHVARRFAHLPPDQTRALLDGFLAGNREIDDYGDIWVGAASRPLAEGVRYQFLRLAVPTYGEFNDPPADAERGVHTVPFSLRGSRYRLRVPATTETAELLGVEPKDDPTWFRHGGMVFSAVLSAERTESVPTVHDLKVEGDETYMTTAALVHNGGKRKGAVCSYLETWHLDIEEFLDLRKNTGDDRRRTHDMHTANWIPDLFMQRVRAGADWTLFSPDEVPDLHDLYGAAFQQRYEEYEAKADAGKLRQHRRLPAVDLWRKMLTRVFETGHPWITFKDPSNIRSPQDHAGVVHSSNLCCMTADQRVVTDRGIVTVGELFEAGGENLVVGRAGVERASAMVLPRPDAPIVEIQTREGYTHKVTPDHKVWKKDRGWVEAQDLKPGDRIETQQVEGLWGPEDRVEAAFLCGLIAGDGTFGEGAVHVDVWDNALHERVRIEHACAAVIRQAELIPVAAPVMAYDEPHFNVASRETDAFEKARLSSTKLCRALEGPGLHEGDEAGRAGVRLAGHAGHRRGLPGGAVPRRRDHAGGRDHDLLPRLHEPPVPAGRANPVGELRRQGLPHQDAGRRPGRPARRPRRREKLPATGPRPAAGHRRAGQSDRGVRRPHRRPPPGRGLPQQPRNEGRLRAEAVGHLHGPEATAPRGRLLPHRGQRRAQLDRQRPGHEEHRDPPQYQRRGDRGL